MKNIFILFFVLLGTKAIGQYDYDSYQNWKLLNNLTQGTFSVYDTTRHKINMVKSQSEVDWTDIGNIVMSKIYANTPEWTLNVYEDTTGVLEDSSHYLGVRGITIQNEFIRPICTYFYNVEGEEAAVTFCTWQTKAGDGEIPLTLGLVKKNGRWYASKRLNIFGVEQVIFAFREQVLAHIFAGKETGNARLNKLMNEVHKNGIIDFEKLFDVLIRLKSDPDRSDYEYYTRAGKPTAFPEFKPMTTVSFKSKVMQPTEIPNLKNHKYKKYDFYPNTYSNKDWVSELSIIKKTQRSVTDTIRFEYRYTFIWDGHPFSLIKYKIGKVQKANVLELINGNWVITDNPRFENFRFFMQCIKYEYFMIIGERAEMQRDPILRKYIPLYKQQMHNLNVDKLGTFLKTKPKEFEPYCDFD